MSVVYLCELNSKYNNTINILVVPCTKQIVFLRIIIALE